MMQSVNFYFENYRPKPLSFDSRFALLVFSVTLVMLVVLGFIKSSHLTQQQTLLASKQTQVVQLEQEVKKMQLQVSQSQASDSIDSQILALQNNLNSYRKILANMRTPDVLQSVAYSQILLELGEQKSTSLWLTKIEIDEQNLSLKGSTLDSKAIPEYVDLLKNAKTLKRQFDELKVERDSENTRLVNFALNNGRISHEQ